VQLIDLGVLSLVYEGAAADITVLDVPIARTQISGTIKSKPSQVKPPERLVTTVSNECFV
jgi:hypothetical protein